LHQREKSFAYNHNLSWTHSSLLTLARCHWALRPQQQVLAAHLARGCGGHSGCDRAAGSAALCLNHRPQPSHRARQTLTPSSPSLSKRSQPAAPSPAGTWR